MQSNGKTWSLPVRSIAHTVIEVSDLARARAFYGERLGLRTATDNWPDGGEVCLSCPSGQRLILRQTAQPRTLPDTAVHQAYRATPAGIDRIVQSLAADSITVHRYHEDRPAEQADNCYFADPDGNRIQLVASGQGNEPGVLGIDHTAVLASDMEWIEEFYVDKLGLAVDHRVGWNTGDYVRARAWGEGKEDMAPGARRWDERYRDIPGGKPGQGRRVPRPNMQIFFQMGDAVLAVYMAASHVQEPPPRQAKGSPRTAYWTDRATIERTAALLEDTRVATLGPVQHPSKSAIAESLYFRDPCGNFIELCAGAGA